MTTNWVELKKELSPIKDFEDLRRRWQEAFSYSFVREKYNLSIHDLIDYTKKMLGEDTRGRYSDYLQLLVETFQQLQKSGVRDILELSKQTETSEQFESFCARTGMDALDLIAALKYLSYWVIPSKKLLSSLVDKDSPLSQAVQVLRGKGIRANLDILQQGLTPADRKTLAFSTGLPEVQIKELVHRADFSRLPWASRATISNITGAGCESLARLANSDPQQLYKDFFDYGASIDKNLKLGNEIDNSHRIARILPRVVTE